MKTNDPLATQKKKDFFKNGKNKNIIHFFDFCIIVEKNIFWNSTGREKKVKIWRKNNFHLLT